MFIIKYQWIKKYGKPNALLQMLVDRKRRVKKKIVWIRWVKITN